MIGYVLVTLSTCKKALLLPKDADLTMFDNTVMEAFYSYSYLIAVIASVTLFMFMTGLNVLFKKMAHLLTEWEYPRTQEIDPKLFVGEFQCKPIG